MAPSLAAAGDRILATWLEPIAAPGIKDKAYTLRFASLSAGAWSAPVTLAAGPDLFANWADFPGLAQAPDGSLAAHWLARIGSDPYAYGIFLARSTDGGATWKPIGSLHGDHASAEHGFVSWVPDRDGLRAFWLDGREQAKNGPMTLRTASVHQTAGPEELLDARVCDCCQTSAALAAGGPVVAYRDRSDGEIRDIAVIRRTAQGWSKPVTVGADHWKIAGCPVNGPALAAAGLRVAVAWFTGAAPGPRVQAAFSADGGATFGTPILVDGAAPIGRVGLVLDGAGDALVSWLAPAVRGAAIRLRRLHADGRAGKPVTVAAARASGVPRIALAGDRLHLAWGEDGEPSKIRVASVPLAGL
jgi:hypothetical protein